MQLENQQKGWFLSIGILVCYSMPFFNSDLYKFYQAVWDETLSVLPNVKVKGLFGIWNLYQLATKNGLKITTLQYYSVLVGLFDLEDQICFFCEFPLFILMFSDEFISVFFGRLCFPCGLVSHFSNGLTLSCTPLICMIIRTFWLELKVFLHV